MTYLEVLDFLFSQLPMYQRVGKAAFKKDLSNTIELCKALGNPQDDFVSIHIAGTNGKGSTAHMIAGILQATGLKVGLYTSPHYRDYRERIKINGKYIPKNEVIQFVKSNKLTIETIRPSFFEMTVGLAFKYFAEQNVDIAVIETGLGGRLDSTNIIHPLVSVITNIGLDHQVFLGDTIPLIAAEKAGIMKMNVPCIIGKRQKDTFKVFEEVAKGKQASLTYAEDRFYLEIQSQEIDQTTIDIISDCQEKFTVKLPSGVAYNIDNCRTAIATVQALNENSDLRITIDDIRAGLSDFPSKTKYLGRWQVKSTDPLVLLDAAHNEDGINSLFDALSQYSFTKLHIILGMVNDKDVDNILKLFPQDAQYYFCRPNIPRGKDRLELQSEAANYQIKGRAYVSCRNALKAAKRAANQDDFILCTGSSFVIAELV